MQNLVILDYSTASVHTYMLSRAEPITLEYICELGFNPSNCNWMTGEIEFVNHDIVLT